jgi:hypothetical protein
MPESVLPSRHHAQRPDDGVPCRIRRGHRLRSTQPDLGVFLSDWPRALGREVSAALRHEDSHMNYRMVLAMLAGVGVGGLAVQGIHAQTKPPAYYIVEIDAKNEDVFNKEWAPKS